MSINEELNLKYKEMYNMNKTTENLERYVLSELYSPLEDYENALDILHSADMTIISKELMFLEVFLCYEHLWYDEKLHHSYFLPLLKKEFSTFSDEEKGLYYYLEALGHINKIKVASENEIISLLDKSIACNTPFVSNYLYRAKYSKDKRQKEFYIEKAYSNILRIIQVEELEKTPLDNIYKIQYYIDSEIKMLEMNEIKIGIWFPNRKKTFAKLLN